MNLAIEYLIRTGAIKNFLVTPCCLFVENFNDQTGKVIYIHDILNCPCSYRVDLWDIVNLPSSDLFSDPAKSTEVPKSEIFESDQTVLDGYRPLPYIDQPLAVCKNAFNHPMQSIEYNYYIKNCLNSGKHHTFKSDWLWRFFTQKFYSNGLFTNDYACLDFWERRSVIEKEQIYVQSKYQQHWSIWGLWKIKFLLHESVAPELIFVTAYETKFASSFSLKTCEA